ncbi:MAG: NADPH-dependent F420 reductase [Candidatus Thorarchaeota archaeon]
MEIGIIGAGKVGQTLGKRWANINHRVTFGVRNLEKYVNLNDFVNISVKNIPDVVSTHGLLVITVPGSTVGNVVVSMGNLANKTIIDATNMFGMKKLIEIAPNANFVKAFNTIGIEIMSNPHFKTEKATLLICGEHKSSLDITAELANDLGFNPLILDDFSFVSDIENFALLWIKMSRKIGREFAFKLLTR